VVAVSSTRTEVLCPTGLIIEAKAFLKNCRKPVCVEVGSSVGISEGSGVTSGVSVAAGVEVSAGAAAAARVIDAALHSGTVQWFSAPE